jgi:branched-subunit amino acid transport protein
LSNLDMLLIVCALVLSTFATRAGLLLIGERYKPSHLVETALRFAPICALAALIAPEILVQSGTVDVSLHNSRLVAATAFFLWKRSMVGCIVVGMLVLTVAR